MKLIAIFLRSGNNTGIILRRETAMVPSIGIGGFETKDTLNIALHNIDIFEKIYGAPSGMEALLGIDFLENKKWQFLEEMLVWRQVKNI